MLFHCKKLFEGFEHVNFFANDDGKFVYNSLLFFFFFKGLFRQCLLVASGQFSVDQCTVLIFSPQSSMADDQVHLPSYIIQGHTCY